MSGKYSKNAEERETAQEAESYLLDLTTRIRQVNSAYANDISSFLLGNSRTFSLIVRHRDYIFDRIEVLKKNEVEMYQKLQSFTLSLQSTLPRLAGIAIGGSLTIPVLISQVFPVSQQTSTLLVAAFGGIGYLIAEIATSRLGGRKLNQTITKYEDQKDKEYEQFLARSRLALELLLNNLIESYQLHVNKRYNLGQEEKEKILDEIMRAADKNAPKRRWSQLRRKSR